MLLHQHSTPTYQRFLIESEYDYVAVVRDSDLITYKKLPGPYKGGWIFTEAHVFDQESDLQSFVESFGIDYVAHWEEDSDL